MMTSFTRNLRAAALVSSLALAACVPQAQPPAPAPVPAPAPTHAPPPPPPQAAAPAHWLDAPQTPGDWFYSGSAAAFGANPSSAIFVMRCDRASRTVTLGRASRQAAGQAMRVHTETTSRQLTATPRAGLLAADVPAADALLDAMAISKGRFAIETGGETTLYLPSWPEATRVIEDCR